MPRLWSATIETHRAEVRDAILDAAAAMVAARGISSVTMSEVAERAGIGRATLYKYFPSVEAVLHAWHERHVGAHLERLAAVSAGAGTGLARLEAVLEAFARVCHERHDGELVALLHQGDHVIRAERKLHDLVRRLIAACAKAGDVRKDVASDELATFCMHALTAAGAVSSKAAVGRLVRITLAGLRTPRGR